MTLPEPALPIYSQVFESETKRKVNMLYLVALIQKPTQKETEDGKQEVLILAPTPVIARDDKSAAVQAVAMNKDKISTDLSNVEVLVRPF